MSIVSVIYGKLFNQASKISGQKDSKKVVANAEPKLNSGDLKKASQKLKCVTGPGGFVCYYPGTKGEAKAKKLIKENGIKIRQEKSKK